MVLRTAIYVQGEPLGVSLGLISKLPKTPEHFLLPPECSPARNRSNSNITKKKTRAGGILGEKMILWTSSILSRSLEAIQAASQKKTEENAGCFADVHLMCLRLPTPLPPSMPCAVASNANCCTSLLDNVPWAHRFLMPSLKGNRVGSRLASTARSNRRFK